MLISGSVAKYCNDTKALKKAINSQNVKKFHQLDRFLIGKVCNEDESSIKR